MKTDTGENQPKYKLILEDLRRNITDGTYKSGDRLPSEIELGETYSVSRLTIQRALKELQIDGTVERRAGSGTYVRARTEPAGHLFGLLIPGLGETEIFEPICQGMGRAGQLGGHTLLWGDTTQVARDVEDGTRNLCEHYIERRVSGVFFAPVENAPNKDRINEWVANRLIAAKVPVVLLDRCYKPYPDRSRFDLVGIDNRRAGHLITRHLLASGAKNPLFWARKFSAATVDARIGGFLDALAEAGIQSGRDRVVVADPADTASVAKAMKEIKPDGVVSANDATAAHLLRWLQAEGIRVPQDLRIVGVDDVRYASLLGVPLTTVRQPCQEIGEIAVQTMLNRIARPQFPVQDILLECQVIIRRSCGK